MASPQQLDLAEPLARVNLPAGTSPFGDGESLRAAGRRVYPLASDVLCAVLPTGHRLADRRSVALDDLADEPWVMEPADTYLASSLHAMCEARGVSPHIVARMNSHVMTLHAVAAGLITVLPSLAIGRRFDGIAVVPVTPKTHRAIVVVSSPAQGRRRGVQVLVRALREQAATGRSGELVVAGE